MNPKILKLSYRNILICPKISRRLTTVFRRCLPILSPEADNSRHFNYSVMLTSDFFRFSLEENVEAGFVRIEQHLGLSIRIMENSLSRCSYCYLH